MLRLVEEALRDPEVARFVNVEAIKQRATVRAKARRQLAFAVAERHYTRISSALALLDEDSEFIFGDAGWQRGRELS